MEAMSARKRERDLDDDPLTPTTPKQPPPVFEASPGVPPPTSLSRLLEMRSSAPRGASGPSHVQRWVSEQGTANGRSGQSAPRVPQVYSSTLATWLPVSRLLGHAHGVQCQRVLPEPMRPAGETKPGATGLVYHAAMLDHRPSLHVECERPQRLEWAVEHLTALGLFDRCLRLPCPEATDEELSAVHDRAHIARVDSAAFFLDANIPVELGGDLYVSKGTARAARLAAGGVTSAALRVARGEVANAFALVRPPGHHCSSTIPSGFCFFNNVAVAAQAALDEVEGVRRVMILDWDVHHGNGTESIFFQNPNVLVVNIHQHFFGKGHVQHKPKLPEGAKALRRPVAPQREPSEPKPAVTADDLMAALEDTTSESSSASTAATVSTGRSNANPVREGLVTVEARDMPPPDAPVSNNEPQRVFDAIVGATEQGEDLLRPRRQRRPVAAAADVDDDAALAFFGALGAETGGRVGVAGRLEGDSSRATSSADEETDSSQRLSWIADFSDEDQSGQRPAGSTSSSSDDGTSSSESSVSRDGYPHAAFYPGTGAMERVGEGPGEGRNVNVPWPCVGFGDAEYMLVLNRLIVPMAREFAPDLVIISSGFDCIAGDTLGSMHVTPTGIFQMTQTVLQHISSKVVVAMEGGYNLRNVALSAEMVLRALLEATQGPAAAAEGSTSLYHQTEQLIEEVKKTHAPYWRCFATSATNGEATGPASAAHA
jgi:acetoin utilization deacetylase AcuC-like enzyme